VLGRTDAAAGEEDDAAGAGEPEPDAPAPLDELPQAASRTTTAPESSTLASRIVTPL